MGGVFAARETPWIPVRMERLEVACTVEVGENNIVANNAWDSKEHIVDPSTAGT